MDTSEKFTHHFAKENDFCKQRVIYLSKMGITLKRKNLLPRRSQSFPLKVPHCEKGGKYFHVTVTVTVFESVSILFKKKLM